MSLLDHVTYASSFFFLFFLTNILFSLTIVSTTFYSIITYVSLVSVSLLASCRASFLVLVSPFSLPRGPLRYCLISTASVLVSVLLLGLSLASLLACVSLLNSFCSILCYCLISTASPLVSLSLLDSSCASLLIPGLCAAPQLTLWYSSLSLNLHGVSSGLCVAHRSVLCVFSGFCVIFTMGRSSTDAPSPHTPCTQPLIQL